MITRAQTCVTNINATSATERFTLNNDGTAIDTATGIMWYRCSLGQTWDEVSSSCTGGSEQVTWQQALQQAAAFNGAGFSNWQLPNIKELSSIVERQCVDSAINLTVFPNSEVANYWSSTTGVDTPSLAWAVAFYSGKSNLRDKSSDVFIRVMRYAN